MGRMSNPPAQFKIPNVTIRVLPKKKAEAGFSVPADGSRMDIPRIGYRQKKWRRNVLLLLLAAALVTGVSIFVARLEPALPAVDRSSVWIDTVSRGPLIRDVRGIGTLVPSSKTTTCLTASAGTSVGQ